MNIKERLQLLRYEMQHNNIDIYLIPSIDGHNNEYVPQCYLRRPWISNFDGSAGEVAVTIDNAYLWTDGRYFLQAEQQIDPKYYTIMKQTGFAPETINWLLDNAGGKRLGIDPQLLSIERAKLLAKVMKKVDGELITIETNLIDNCKLKLGESIDIPSVAAFALSDTYTGQSLHERLSILKAELKSRNVDYIALNVLDEIAWLFNIRGRDIEYNPVVICYALISQTDGYLFIDKHKIPAELADILSGAGVEIIDYNKFSTYLRKINGVIWLDDKTANHWMFINATQNGKVYLSRSPIVALKACKNSVEALGSRYAHVKDATAVIGFLAWLDKNWKSGVDELSCVEELSKFRLKQENFKGESFSTISGFASNGAIIHYGVTPKTNKIIDDSSIYLLDSGGQYLDGTTDITRTIHLGLPTQEQKHNYTLVLQGHLALGRAVFPHGTCGEHLDAFARAPLWNKYLNYAHGTGHGVGSFLCVHEGPQRISTAPSGVALLPGMIVSNEPGLYIEGEYGIRIENLCIVSEIDNLDAKNSIYGPFYKFDTLTLVPYCKKLIDVSMLSLIEIEQIKEYYAVIKEKVYGRLEKTQQAWLDEQLSLFS